MSATAPALVHDLELLSWRTNDKADLAIQVRDPRDGETSWLYFLGQSLQAVTFEHGDRVDAIIEPPTINFKDGSPARRISYLWPTIRYVGPVAVDTSGYAYKADHEQALLFKAGERHERSVAALLRSAGHDVTAPQHTGRVEIMRAPEFKRRRKPDLRCANCNRKFEVKSFLRPPVRVRVSHSASRTWQSENDPSDVHVFAYGDDVIIVANSEILAAWESGYAHSGKFDRYWSFRSEAVRSIDEADLRCANHPPAV